MARMGAVFYLVLASAAGPSLCCCTVSNLFAFRVQACRHSCCCTRHSTSPGGETNAPKQQHRCPCGERRQDLTYLSSMKSASTDHSSGLLPLPGTAGIGCSSPQLHSLLNGALIGAPKECIAFPFHNPGEILRALHVLRC
jgi:hypothetical protein